MAIRITLIHEFVLTFDMSGVPQNEMHQRNHLFRKLVGRKDGVSGVSCERPGVWRISCRHNYRGVERLADDIKAIACDIFHQESAPQNFR